MVFVRYCENDWLRFNVYAILKYRGVMWYSCRLLCIYCWTSNWVANNDSLSGSYDNNNGVSVARRCARTVPAAGRSLARASCMRAYAGCVIIVRVTRIEGSTRNVWCVAIYAAADRDALAGRRACMLYYAGQSFRAIRWHAKFVWGPIDFSYNTYILTNHPVV